jgi:hypothetical protein
MPSDAQRIDMIKQLTEEERSGRILDIHTIPQLVSAVCMVSSLTPFTAGLMKIMQEMWSFKVVR